MNPAPPPQSAEGPPNPSAPPDGGGHAGRIFGFFLGILAFIALTFFVQLDPARPSVSAMAGVTALMSIWWIFEAIPLPVTALVPLVLFPALGLMKGGEVAPLYMDSTIFVFVGGFFIAIAMERWNLHRRIALTILRVVGGGPRRLALGFMLSTGCISMWISNTATAMMMMPMALSIVRLHEEVCAAGRARGEPVRPGNDNVPLVILLAIAYAANIGGLGTLIGTPTNLILVATVETTFPLAPPVSFVQWAAFGVPLSLTFLVLAWFVMTRFIFPLPAESPFSGREFIRGELDRMGPMAREEKHVLAVFATTALLWVFRADMEIGEHLTIPGWSRLFPKGGMIDDGTVAIAMGMLLFILPARRRPGLAGERLMDWEWAKKMPWGILLLFGGGFALAAGFTRTGLSGWIGERFAVLEGAPPWVIVLAVTAIIVVFTEFASNMATAQMSLPVLAALSRTIHVHPLLLMLPATAAASCGFMMPMGTGPNMIAFGTERVPMLKMVWAGFWLNLMGIALITVFALALALPIFGASGGDIPTWAMEP